jgi:hypothetical protein
MTDGAWELVLIGGPYEGATNLWTVLEQPPERIMVGMCPGGDWCQPALQGWRVEHPHVWWWLEEENEGVPREVTLYGLAEEAFPKARYAPVGVDVPVRGQRAESLA